MSHDEPRRLVLVVDDDEVVRKVVRMVLEADDFEVLEAADGIEALASVASEHPPLMVLDVMMPGMDGIEVLHRLPPDVKVLMLTARDDAQTEAATRAAGADGFLAKPFSSVELLDHVERLVGAANGAKATT
jgi:DNA-binding response OmpR family regulator